MVIFFVFFINSCFVELKLYFSWQHHYGFWLAMGKTTALLHHVFPFLFFFVQFSFRLVFPITLIITSPFLSNRHCTSFFRRSWGDDLPFGLAFALGFGFRRFVESEVICAESLSHLGGRACAQPLHGLYVDIVCSEAGELWRRIHLRGTFSDGHPLIASFLGLLGLEVEVPALGIFLCDLLKFLVHESQVLAVVDGAKQVLPQLARLVSSDRQAGGTSWPWRPDSVVENTRQSHHLIPDDVVHAHLTHDSRVL